MKRETQPDDYGIEARASQTWWRDRGIDGLPGRYQKLTAMRGELADDVAIQRLFHRMQLRELPWYQRFSRSLVVGGLVIGFATGYAAWREQQATPADADEQQRQAVALVLRDADALRHLRLCAPELEAEAAFRHNQAAAGMKQAGPDERAYQAAAALASPALEGCSLSTVVSEEVVIDEDEDISVRVTPMDVTPFDVAALCVNLSYYQGMLNPAAQLPPPQGYRPSRTEIVGRIEMFNKLADQTDQQC